MVPALPTALPRQLMGPLGDTKADIENLQRALKNLAQATQRPDIDPGNVDGVVGTPTVTAIIAAQTLISAELPSWAFLALQAALSAGAMTSIAKEGVAKAAVPLTVAANTAAVKFRKDPALIPGACTGFFCPGWYKTPIGLGLIAVAAFVGYKLFIAEPAKA